MTGRLVLLFCLFAAPLAAQQRLTLQDAITRALERNFDIRVANVSAEQATVNNTTGNAGLLPNINGNAGLNAGSSNTRIEFADGRIQEVNNAQTISYNAGVTASYTVFAAGRAWLIKKTVECQRTACTGAGARTNAAYDIPGDPDLCKRCLAAAAKHCH